ncbi:hypothetical protein T459_14595 [Capsicum annuum]|uniref:Uncharacterized protein n=1 Tax=Capsicum annuum TaxID=4072 RepID=A0A2G2ZHW0_CAPAN|nr:hypothetical protein T459_14595 [Capsicum annuum]
MNVYTCSNGSILAEYIPFSNSKLKIYKHVDIPCTLFLSLAHDLKRLKEKHECSISKSNLTHMSAARRRLSKLYSAFLFCLSEMGAWMDFEVNFVPCWLMWMMDMCHPKLIVFSSLFSSAGNELPLKFSSGTSQLNEGSVGIISIAREDWVPSADSSVAEVKDERIPKVSDVPKGRSDSESLHTVENVHKLIGSCKYNSSQLRKERAVQKAKETELNKTIHITEGTLRVKQMLATMSHEIRSSFVRSRV